MPQQNLLTTRFPGGFTNAAPGQIWGSAGFPDPAFAYAVVEDCLNGNFGTHWSSYAIGGIYSSTQQSAAGGVARFKITPDASATATLQYLPAQFRLAAGVNSFFKIRCSLPDATAHGFAAGFGAYGPTPQTLDGVHLVKAAGSTTFSLLATKNGVTTTVALPGSISSGVFFEVGFHISQTGDIEAYLDTASPSKASLSGRVGVLPAGSVSNTSLFSPYVTISQPAAPAAYANADVDYIVAAVER